MLLKKTTVAILSSIFILSAVMIIIPLTKTKVDFSVNSKDMIVSDADAVYIDGEVSLAFGQKIIAKVGNNIVSEKTLPNNGKKSSFKLKIPSEEINREKPTKIYIQSTSNDEVRKTASQKVQITYKAKKPATIQTDKVNYSMIWPGDIAELNARTSFDTEFEFESSDPSVATVNESGQIETVGAGNATITIKSDNNPEYQVAEKKVSVNVKEVPYYTVVLHANNGTEDYLEQKIPCGYSASLIKTGFEKDGKLFRGWAYNNTGIVRYDEQEVVTDVAEEGDKLDLYALWYSNKAQAAIDWGIKIANDNSFSYGTGKACHRTGCYFCGTNQRNKPKGYEKTYVCMTFVGAAYAHGAEDPEILAACKACRITCYLDNNNFTKFSCWEKVGACRDLTINDLEPGDVVVRWSNDNGRSGGHVWMYAGEDYILDSRGEGWGANTISLHEGAAAQLRRYGNQTTKNYVMRYKG